MAVTSNAPKPAPRAEPRRLTILGATGSVGRNTIDLIERDRDSYIVEALTANRNARELAELARRIRPRLAVVADEAAYGDLKSSLDCSGAMVAAGAEAFGDTARAPVHRMIGGILGAAGL